MTKEFGKLTREQIRELFAYFYPYLSQMRDLFRSGDVDLRKINNIFALAGSWGMFYEIPHIQNLAIFSVLTGLNKDLHEAAISVDPQQMILDKLEHEWDPETWKPKALTEEQEAVAICTYMALFGNIESVCAYGVSLSTLVERVGNGDDDALFEAVIIDRAVISTTPIANRICEAQLANDNTFFDKLAKSLTKTKPRRPSNKLDEIRYFSAMLEEAKGLDQITQRQLEELFIDELDLYPDGRKDVSAALKKLISKVKSNIRK